MLLKTNQLQALRKEKGWTDSWWFSTNATVSTAPCKLTDVPRTGTVSVLNADEFQKGSNDWIQFQYPGYVTLSEKQKVALEFMGYHLESITLSQASELLNTGFNDPSFDSKGYFEYKWEQRHRIYSKREILEELFNRMQTQEFLISERVSAATKNKAIDQALSEGVDENQFSNFLTTRFPKIILAQSTKLRKTAHKQFRDQFWNGLSEFEKSSEAPSSSNRTKIILGFLALILILFLLFHFLAN